MTPADQSQDSARATRERHPQVLSAYMCIRRVKSGHCVKSMNPKSTNKSLIHENADANITCDFGDGDISRLGVANQTHAHMHHSLAQFIKINAIFLIIQNTFKTYTHPWNYSHTPIYLNLSCSTLNSTVLMSWQYWINITV